MTNLMTQASIQLSCNVVNLNVRCAGSKRSLRTADTGYEAFESRERYMDVWNYGCVDGCKEESVGIGINL